MTAKDKARELADKYYQILPLTKDVITTNGELSWKYDNWKEAKQCAMICVDEILDMVKHTPIEDIETEYWQQVKKELEAL